MVITKSKTTDTTDLIIIAFTPPRVSFWRIFFLISTRQSQPASLNERKVLNEISKMVTDTITPLEALNLMHKWKSEINREKVKKDVMGSEKSLFD